MVYKFEFIEMESNEGHGFEIDFESEASVFSQLLFQGFELNYQGNILVNQQQNVRELLVGELISEATYEEITGKLFLKLTRFITQIQSLSILSRHKPYTEEDFKEYIERIRKQNGGHYEV